MVPSDKEECHEKFNTHLEETPEEVNVIFGMAAMPVLTEAYGFHQKNHTILFISMSNYITQTINENTSLLK